MCTRCSLIKTTALPYYSHTFCRQAFCSRSFVTNVWRRWSSCLRTRPCSCPGTLYSPSAWYRRKREKYGLGLSLSWWYLRFLLSWLWYWLKEADLALQIVEGLGVHSPEHPTLTPVPSQEFVLASLEREAIRRIFWLIHLLDVIASIYFKKPVTFTDSELRLRLPVDETSFEMGVHSTLPGGYSF